jgi:hypothetical protein
MFLVAVLSQFASGVMVVTGQQNPLEEARAKFINAFEATLRINLAGASRQQLEPLGRELNIALSRIDEAQNLQKNNTANATQLAQESMDISGDVVAEAATLQAILEKSAATDAIFHHLQAISLALLVVLVYHAGYKFHQKTQTSKIMRMSVREPERNEKEIS